MMALTDIRSKVGAVTAKNASAVMSRWQGVRTRAANGLTQLSKMDAGHVLQAARSLGVVGAAGSAMLVVAAAIALFVLMPLRQQAAVLGAQLSTGDTTVATTDSSRAVTPVEKLNLFLMGLPTRAQLPTVLALIATQADATGLQLERGNYVMNQGKAGELAHYDVTLPVHGSYPAVRQFIDATMVAVPAIALESLTLERPAVADAMMNAELKFTIFVRGAQ